MRPEKNGAFVVDLLEMSELCVYMFGAKCIFAFLHHAHTPVQIVYVHANRKVIDTMYGGKQKKKAVLPLPCPLKNRFREIFIRFCHLT